MIGYVGVEVSIVTGVYPRGTVSISSLGYFSSMGSSYKPSHPYFLLSLEECHVQEFSRRRGGGIVFIKTQPEKAKNKERTKQSKVIV